MISFYDCRICKNFKSLDDKQENSPCMICNHGSNYSFSINEYYSLKIIVDTIDKQLKEEK